MPKSFYHKIKLDQKSQDDLKTLWNPHKSTHRVMKCDHITLYAPTEEIHDRFHLANHQMKSNKVYGFRTTHLGISPNVMAVKVKLVTQNNVNVDADADDFLKQLCENKFPHITLGRKTNARSKEANDINIWEPIIFPLQVFVQGSIVLETIK